MNELIEWLGWRSFLKKETPVSVLREEFKRQVLTLRVLRECMYPRNILSHDYSSTIEDIRTFTTLCVWRELVAMSACSM